MADHLSAFKRKRQNKKRRARNASRRSQVHTAERKLVEAIEENNVQAAKDLLPKTISQINRAKSKGVLHPKTAARKISRLSRATHRAKS